VAKELALKQSCWNGRTADLDESMSAALAQFVNGPRDQLLSAASLAVYKNCGIGGSYGFDLPQYPAQNRAIADDFVEAQLASNLVFEIKLFLSELIRKFGDLAIGERIIDRDCDLSGNLKKKLHILFSEGALAEPGDGKDSENSAATRERQQAEGLEAFLKKCFMPGIQRQFLSYVTNP